MKKAAAAGLVGQRRHRRPVRCRSVRPSRNLHDLDPPRTRCPASPGSGSVRTRTPVHRVRRRLAHPPCADRRQSGRHRGPEPGVPPVRSADRAHRRAPRQQPRRTHLVVRLRAGLSVYEQIKSSNTDETVVDAVWLTKPVTVTSKSPLQHFHTTWAAHRHESPRPEFRFVTNRAFDPADPILKLHDKLRRCCAQTYSATGAWR